MLGNKTANSEPGEVTPLPNHGIVAVNCVGQKSEEAGVAAGSSSGVGFADGRMRMTFDLLLEVAQQRL